MAEATTGESSWWTDDPIKSFRNDRLQRGPFAKQIAKVITQIGESSTSSTVVAVTGPWGSGKTSTLSLALQHLDREVWRIEWLNPWALSGPEAVTHELFATINAAMPEDRKSRKLRNAVREHGQYATPLLAAVPYAGDAIVAWQGTAKTRYQENSSLDRRATALAMRFKKIANRILVVVDDIDRLQPEELLALFKSVRVLGRLPNVHYLLAFDQDTLLQVLNQTGIAHNDEARGLAFLEKLVTVRLDQPPTRADQSDELLAEGIRSALAAASFIPTDDQSVRLALEREALFVPLLAEPRKVTRFVAQIHSYLPLVGINEVDIVDFLVLTFLRLAYPRVYQGLADDQTLLTDAVEMSTGLQAWANGERIVELLGGDDTSGTRRATGTLQQAITRLFPNIANTDASPPQDREQRRRDRRVSDHDYVSRYFALNSEADPLSDATLTAALHHWAIPTSDAQADAPESNRVLDALADNDPQDRTVPRILRRMTARVSDLDECECGYVAAFLLTRSNLLSQTISTREATTALIAILIATVPPDAANMSTLGVLDRLGTILDGSVDPGATSRSTRETTVKPSTGPRDDPNRWVFTTLVSALRQTMWRPNLHDEAEPTFLDRIAEMCMRTAGQIIDTDLRLGDDAPLHGATAALRLLEDVTGSSSVERRLLAALNTGTTLDTVAARFVDIGTDQATGQSTMVGFDTGTFVARFSRNRVEDDREHLAAIARIAQFDDNDISWPSRRTAAARELIKAINSLNRAPTALEPLERLHSYALTDLRSGFLPTSGGNLPDLQLAVAFQLGGSPGTDAPSNSMSTERREALLIEMARRSNIVGWLEENRAAWRIRSISPWETTDGHPHLWSQVECSAKGAPAENGGPAASPIQLKMKCEVTKAPGSDLPALQLSVAIAFRLAGLSEDREPDQRVYNDDPVPAALTLAELHGLVVALLGCRETARGLWADLTSDTLPSTWETQVATVSRPAMARNIDLRHYACVSETRHQSYDITYNVTREAVMVNAWTQYPDDYSAASAVINEWAQLEGRRALANDLSEIELRRT